MVIRGLFATLFVGLLALHRGALRRRAAALHPLVGPRACGEAGATMLFHSACKLPLANVSAAAALPLAVTMEPHWLREAAGWRRWLAIAVGFTGVMIIVRPGFRVQRLFPLGLACVGFCTVRDLATRRCPPKCRLPVSTITAARSPCAGC